MGTGHDYVALEWVKGEIGETLIQARQALEAYENNRDDIAQIRFCLNYIHQVHGTLQMVEFYGAALLAEEMERLTEKLLARRVERVTEAISVLMQAILKLPDYLDYLTAGRKDIPVQLLPILNELRSCRGAPALSDRSLFIPNLTPVRFKAPEAAKERFHDEKMVDHLKKLRKMYRAALLGIRKGEKVQDNFKYLNKVAVRMEKLCQHTPHQVFWNVVACFTDLLSVGDIELNGEVQTVIADIEHVLKDLYDERHHALVLPVNEDVLKSILYFIARSTTGLNHAQAVKERFSLATALSTEEEVEAEKEADLGPGKETINSVTSVIFDEMNRIKDQLDLFVRRDTRDVNDLEELLPGLHQISNTITILGLSTPRQVIEEQIEVIQQHLDSGRVPEDPVIMDIAGALLFVEGTLTGLSTEARKKALSSRERPPEGESVVGPGQIEAANDAVLTQIRNGLEQAKNCIVSYSASGWNKAEIEEAPGILSLVKGGLQIITLDRAAALVDACKRFVEKALLASDQPPRMNQLETLADGITSIEYYLERLAAGSTENDLILDIAEESLASLGFPVDGEETYQVPVLEAGEEEVVEPPVLAEEKERDGELIDEEIIEIFIEEAQEVIEAIHTHFPAYRNDPADRNALTELRRAFHTLKGSGRLVGATAVGELAWSVENMLNRVIDNTIAASDQMFDLLARVIDFLPQTIRAFEENSPAPDISHFVSEADAIAANKQSQQEQEETASDLQAAQLIREAEGDWEEADEGTETEDGSSAPDDTEVAAESTGVSSGDETLIYHPTGGTEAKDVSEAEAEVSESSHEDEVSDEVPASEDIAMESAFSEMAQAADETEEPEEALLNVEEDEEDLIDDEIIEIFMEEAEEVLETIGTYLPAYLAENDNREALTELRRAFHTLKGSGRMVGALVVGELAWSVENLLNKIIDGSVFMNPDVADLLRAVHGILPDLVDDFRYQRKPSHDTAPLEAQANALAKGELVEPLDVPAASSESETVADEPGGFDVSTQEEAPLAESVEEASASGDREEAYTLDEDSVLVDPVLLEIFESETRGHLASLREFCAACRASKQPMLLTDVVSRALHTLKGSANTAAIEPIANIVVPTERFFKDARTVNVEMDEPLIELLESFVDLVAFGLDQLKTSPQQHIPGTLDYLKDLAAVQLEKLAHYDLDSMGEPSDKPDTQLINIFLTTSIDILLDAERILEHWKENPVPGDELEQLVDELKSLAEGAHNAELGDIEELCRAIELAYEHARDETFVKDDHFIETIIEAHDVLLNEMDQVAAGLATHRHEALLEKLAALAPPESVGQAESADTKAGVAPVEVMVEPTADASDEAEKETEAEEEVAEAPADASGGALDPEMAEIFLEEAHDLIDTSAEQLELLVDDMQNKEVLGQLQRTLHTLKGGARMSGITPIGDLAHELESLFERLGDGRLEATVVLGDLLFRCHDKLAEMVDQVETGGECEPADDLVQQVRDYISGVPADVPEPAVTEQDEATSIDEAPVAYEPELVEIFLEEAVDIISNTSDLIEDWRHTPDDSGVVQALQRELHTLKGGARMAELAPVGDLAHAMEDIFERVVDGRLTPDETMIQAIVRSHDQLSVMIDRVANQKPVVADEALLSELRQILERREAPSVETTEVPTDASAPEIEAPTFETPAAPEEETPAEVSGGEDETASLDFGELDEEMVEIFLEEAQELIDSTANSLQEWTRNFDDIEVSKSLQRDMHTLKGGARMAGIAPIGDLAHELETLFESIVEERVKPNEAIKDLMLLSHDALATMVDEVVAHRMPKPANELISLLLEVEGGSATEAVIGETIRMEHAGETSAHVVTDPDHENLIEAFLDEAGELLASISDGIDVWKENPDNLKPVTDVQNLLNNLEGSARLATVEPVDKLATALSQALGQTLDGRGTVTEELLTLADQAIVALRDMLDKLANEQPVPRNVELIKALSTLNLGEEREVSEEVKTSEEDTEVIEIFLEEASDLLASIDEELAEWAKEPEEASHNQALQRALHTLKGGARLSGLKQLGDATHTFETMLIQSEASNPVFAGEFREQAQAHFDTLNHLVESVRKSHEAMVKRQAVKPAGKPSEATEAGSGTVAKVPAKGTAKPPKAAQAAPRQVQQESIRVNAGLLDELVNLAGETSITRGRLETQISEFSHTLVEMGATIERLKEQLRRMEIETEAQVLFRVEREAVSGQDYGEDFDPLEMDRYSTLQQLSRALSESASDLLDLKEELSEKSRDAETLLLQQSRTNTELQEGLMKTRMIPFSSMVPRLRRIVRQVSTELRKKVEFDVHNAEGEMDRTVLDRMVAPLEHMLRNALDHGIESREKRLQAGKPETGLIELSLSREGGDVVLKMKDDGGGIPVDVIRKKAIERGLLDPTAEVSDREVLQFIMQAGFSTAEKVTQISGRGVGMDVVASEIKQLGGQISIDSEIGKGTTFTIRLPFTVSVNRALMVNTGDDFYAIPLNTIEGIVRVSSYELEEYYKPDAPMYEYAGKQYKLKYIGSLLQSSHKPKLQGQALPLPVILVRGGEQSMALQVDSLLGSREIVVKSLGSQFSGVRGVSGATILGDGSVVVILDLPALIRADMTTIFHKPETEEVAVAPTSYRPTRVMVVDDSVTVRKVTSRLLQRNGMEVITAKDGMDAVSILQETKPDIMLLDIEMPRMDGFEVASFVRHDENLQDVPIVMITSRTGQKHKDRAMSIGVNEYLGKPFQEKTLLSTIEKLVRK